VKAAVYHGRQDIRVQEWPEPTALDPGDVRLEVLCASICGTDVGEYLRGPTLIPLSAPHPASGHAGPVVLGHEIVGRVVEVGSTVSDFVPGDRVVPGSGVSCGRCPWCAAGRTNLCASYYTIGLHAHGGLAELVDVPARICHRVGDECADADAVMVQPLAVALHAVRRARVRPGEVAAVIGTGGLGALIVGALVLTGVTTIGVDISPASLAVAQRVGASAIVDAGEPDAAGAIRSLAGGDGPALVVEASGVKNGLECALTSVRRGGEIQVVGLQHDLFRIDFRQLVLNEITISTSKVHVCDVDVPAAIALLEGTNLGWATFDSIVALEDVVSGGFDRLARGEAAGRIVVTPRHRSLLDPSAGATRAPVTDNL
jgi:(R,R)-butanediol dehydrogenase/meso-butanediol dehydrogenase/diacetyl reductase